MSKQLRIGRRLGSVTLLVVESIKDRKLRIGRRLGSVTLRMSV